MTTHIQCTWSFSSFWQHLMSTQWKVFTRAVLRARTKETNTAEQICEKAKEIDACKKDMQEFQSSFVPLRKFNFSRKGIVNLKTRAAEFLVRKFGAIHSHPGMASQQPWQQRQAKICHQTLFTKFVWNSSNHQQSPPTWIFYSGKVT